jgi:hypothetical protein
MIRYKNYLSPIIIFFIYIFILYFHLGYINQIGFKGDAAFYIEYSSRIFDESSDPIMFRPFFYLYGNLSQKIFGFNDYSIAISNLILFGVNSYLTFLISKRIIENNFLSLIPSLLYLSSPTVNLAATIQITTMLGTFLVLLFVVFFFRSKDEIEKNYLKYSVYFALFALALLLTHEELILVVIINSLILFKKFFSKIKYVKFLVLQFITFLSSWILMFLSFGTVNIFKNITLQFLNVIPLDINFFIRSKYYKVDHDFDFSISTIFNFFNESIVPIIPNIFINKYLILIIFVLFLYLYFKNKILDNDLDNLNINLLFYFLISIVTIRAGARQFVNYYPIFFISFVFAVDYIFNYTLKDKYKSFFSTFVFLFIVLFTISSSYPDGYKNTISRERILFDNLKDKVNNDNKILLLSTFYNAGKARGPRYKINGKYTENKTLSNLVYFGENAILMRNHLRFTNSSSDFKNFIKKNKIKFALFSDHYPDFIYTKKEYTNLIRLFPDNEVIFSNRLVKLKKGAGLNHLKLFQVDLDQLYSFNSALEIDLVNQFATKKTEMDFFSDTHLKNNKKIYLLEF